MVIYNAKNTIKVTFKVNQHLFVSKRNVNKSIFTEILVYCNTKYSTHKAGLASTFDVSCDFYDAFDLLLDGCLDILPHTICVLRKK